MSLVFTRTGRLLPSYLHLLPTHSLTLALTHSGTHSLWHSPVLGFARLARLGFQDAIACAT